MAHGRRQNLFELVQLVGDTIAGGAFCWDMERVRSAEVLLVDACRYCGSISSIANYECSACGCAFPFIDRTNIDQDVDVTQSARILWNEAAHGDRFGHPNRIPLTDKQIEMKAFAKIGKRVKQG